MRFSNVAASLMVGGLGALVLVGGGCGDDPPAQQQPQATCALTDQCVVADKECVAIVNNEGAMQFGLRMSQIIINKPAILGPTTTVGGAVSGGIALDLPACFLTGEGTFSWLLYFDTMANTVCTGGAKVVANPADGYTFVNEMIGGFQITPVKFDSDLSANTFSVATGQDIVVPIFLADPTKPPVLLPLRKAKILNGTLSDSHNCVGSFNAEGLDPYANCGPLASDQQYSFKNGGSIQGHITLEDADEVVVDILSASLCTVLTGEDDGGMPIKKCKRDGAGKIAYQGDWCDGTDAAADATCADAVQLGADFAASAVKVNGGCPIP
jgi:hypothetical protein